MSLDFWNERYAQNDFAYGKQPNQFLKEVLPNLKRGSILFPCEGEGRNAVYATEQAWQVTAFDQSKEGQAKAQKLAQERFVNFQYDLQDAFSYSYDTLFDVVGLFFAHFTEEEQKTVYQKFCSSIKEGGYLLGELFSENQLAYQKKYNSGGPANEKILLSIDKMRSLFADIEFEILTEQEVVLDEGPYHQGKARTIRFLGQKKTILK